MFILDTNVISELRKIDRATPSLVKWAGQQPVEQLFLSAISVWELEYGILLMERKDTTQGAVLREWYEGQVLPAYDGRILPVDLAAARACAPMHVPNKKADRDSFIGATAVATGMTVVTRNEKDFDGMNCQLLNPWKE